MDHSYVYNIGSASPSVPWTVHNKSSTPITAGSGERITEVIDGMLLVMICDAVSLTSAPDKSVAVATHSTTSPEEAIVEFKFNGFVVPKEFPPLNHSYVTFRLSPSGSVAIPTHVSSPALEVPFVVKLAEILGALLSSVRVALSEDCAISESTAKTEHVTVSPGSKPSVERSRTAV